jgi:heterodisulfide reductase subunit A
VARIHKKMEKIGLRPERLQLEWISAAEGIRFAETMKRMEQVRRSVTAEEIAETQSILSKL